MTAADSVNFVRGTEEYVTATVTASATLAAQTVEISINRSNENHVWLPAQWTGSSGTTRDVRTTDPVTFSLANYPYHAYQVFVRVTDSPEIPIMSAGTLTIG